MSTISHQPTRGVPERPGLSAQLLVAEMWASIAIFSMWVAVAVAAIWGPDFVSTSAPGGSSTTIPSGIFVAVFATVGTWAVAKYAFPRHRDETD